MSGQRISGRAYVPAAPSPPFGAFEGTDGDGDGNVYRAYTTDAAGLATAITNLDDGGSTSEGMRNPVVSPDGNWILFELANPSTGYPEIWIVAATPGSTPTQLVSDASNYLMHPAWGADSDTFAYVRGAAGAISGGSIEIDTRTAVGSPTTLKSASGGFSPYRPLFSPDGTQIAYLWDQDVGGTGHLRVMDADGSNDAALDMAVKYRFQGPQHSWSHDGTMIAYDDGASGSNAAYVIGADGTGQTQINSNGDAASAGCRVSDRAWPPDDSYVVISANLGAHGWQAHRAELDGSDTTTLNASHGAYNNSYFEQVLIADSRIWFIESATVVASHLLDGTDYRVDLTIDGAAMDDFSTGDGWFYN